MSQDLPAAVDVVQVKSYKRPEVLTQLATYLTPALFRRSLSLGHTSVELKYIDEEKLAELIPQLPPYLILACYLKVTGNAQTLAWLAERLGVTKQVLALDIRNMTTMLTKVDDERLYSPDYFRILLVGLINRGMKHRTRSESPYARFEMTSEKALELIDAFAEEKEC